MSEYNQSSFVGGMNLLGDDSRLQPTQYRAGFDLTNRYDVLDPVLVSQLDTNAPTGLKQELVTFGSYVILFVAGYAYYRLYTDIGWQKIDKFHMDEIAPRYWTAAIPIATTNYGRMSVPANVGNIVNGVVDITTQSTVSTNPVVKTNSIAAAFAGNLPGLLVQDNINQPEFIFIDTNGYPTTRTIQKYSEWNVTYDLNPTSSTYGQLQVDQREYVPIGQCMSWVDGVLYIVSQDGNSILRSVSGRPLDFVINVDINGQKGGDANSTSYSVGVGGISCIRASTAGGILVTASSAIFQVTKNMTPSAVTEFGEYTFIRTFLFNSTNLSDRTIIDTLGDTRFIDLTGVRSFNAVAQLQNEGKNSPFTSTIQAAFGSDTTPIVQESGYSAAILYNNYELYAMQTIFGPTICKYDTLNSCWTSFDLSQTHGSRVKIFSKIELTIQRLYAITEDNELYTLYIGPGVTNAIFRTIGICSTMQYGGSNIKLANPKSQIKLDKTRVILNKITEDCNCDFIPYINNRLLEDSTVTKKITFEEAKPLSNNPTDLPDVNSQLMNLLYTTTNAGQGWKVFGVFRWTGGSFTQFAMELTDNTPDNPPNSQELTT